MPLSTTKPFTAGAFIRIGQVVYGVIEGEDGREVIRVYPATKPEHKAFGVALGNAEAGEEVDIIVKGEVMTTAPDDGPYGGIR